MMYLKTKTPMMKLKMPMLYLSLAKLLVGYNLLDKERSLEMNLDVSITATTVIS